MSSPQRTPKISVIIPHYNDPDGLDRSLDALWAQDYPLEDVEIIVADNRSNIGLEAVIARAGSRARVVDAPQQGPGPARNAGVAAARANWLAFIDSDCVAAPNWLAVIDRELTAARYDILGGDVGILTANTRLTSIEAYESIYGYQMQDYIERHHYAGTGNLAMPRAIFDAVGPFRGMEVAEDINWGNRAHAMGLRIGYIADMRIATPARQSFAELRRKWARHIGHEYAKLPKGPIGRLKWLIKAMMLGLSPVAEVARIATTSAISGLGTRARAFGCLTRIRLYRAMTMAALAMHANPDRLTKGWRDNGL
ncbi:MAG: glycosyltransferase family A protein [Parasphingorhabdus sp.]|nr:glycosyltransferase family A protein [Parasphingorhabdus sp.]